MKQLIQQKLETECEIHEIDFCDIYVSPEVNRDMEIAANKLKEKYKDKWQDLNVVDFYEKFFKKMTEGLYWIEEENPRLVLTFEIEDDIYILQVPKEHWKIEPQTKTQ